MVRLGQPDKSDRISQITLIERVMSGISVAALGFCISFPVEGALAQDSVTSVCCGLKWHVCIYVRSCSTRRCAGSHLPHAAETGREPTLPVAVCRKGRLCQGHCQPPLAPLPLDGVCRGGEEQPRSSVCSAVRARRAPAPLFQQPWTKPASRVRCGWWLWRAARPLLAERAACPAPPAWPCSDHVL